MTRLLVTAVRYKLFEIWTIVALVAAVAFWAWVFPGDGAWHWLLVLPTWGLLSIYPPVAYWRWRDRLTQRGEAMHP